jgi:beta-mannosidase
MADVTLNAKIARHDASGKVLLEVTLTNPTSHIAVMTHLQLRNQRTNERVLPVFYSDNYVSILPGESKTLTIEAPGSQLSSDQPLVVVDGWNVSVNPASMSTNGGAAIAPNANAIVTRPSSVVVN